MVALPKILVVDDEPKICEFLEMLFQREGYLTDKAFTGNAAVEKLRSSKYDLMITDLKMPGMDGFELAKRAKEIDRDLPLVVITGYATIRTAIQALRQGVDDYVTKPFRIDEMRKVIARVLAKARLEIENRRLVGELEAANAELRHHREALKDKVRLTGEDLERANADLRQRVHELAMLNGIALCAVSEPDVDKMLDTCARLVVEKLAVMRSSILLREGDWLVVKACQGNDVAALLGTRVRVGEGVTGRVAQSGEPILAAREAAAPPSGAAVDASVTGSLLCVPMTYKKDNLGVILAVDKQSGEPFTPSDLRLLTTIASQVAPAIESARLFRELEESSYAAVRALVAALEAKDPYLRGHSVRVTQYSQAIGKVMGLKEKDLGVLERAGQLHDLGKLGVSDLILNKATFLTPEEYEVVKQHPVLGEEIIRPLEFLSDVRPVIRHHHERFDGTGYPDGQRDDEIPFLCRIMSVADAFDAMTTARPYRSAKDVAVAHSEILSLREKQFDARMVEGFCEAVAAGGLPGLQGV
jgi:response regulator RpfG family c-di-GMP phosphodiesterase